MSVFFIEDLCKNHIFCDLSVADIYSFSRVCKSYEKYGTRENLSEKLNKIIEIRLSEIFGHRLSDFYSVLEQSGSVISGSFLLQCILNKRWEYVDLDIYVPIEDYNSFSEINKFIREELYSICQNHSQRYFGQSDSRTRAKFMSERKILVYDEHLDKFGHDKLRKILKNTRDCRQFNLDYNRIEIEKQIFRANNVQIVSVDGSKDKMFHFIDNEFDFDICKNMYSRKKNQGFVQIKSFHDIVSKIIPFRFTHNEQTSKFRRDRYETRGFKFYEDDHSSCSNLSRKYEKEIRVEQ